MTYSSDFRVKVLLRDIQIRVTKKLHDEGKHNPLRLRIFDESHDDQKMWHDGGLTFFDENGKKLGSNDAAWYLDETWVDPISKQKSDSKPVLVVEGSYGTETGNVGSAQKARFNHAVGMAKRNIIGAYLIPKISEYYKVSKNNKPPPPIMITKGYWMKDIVSACLAISEASESGKYLMIDAYQKQYLVDLVYSLAKNDPLAREKTLDSILCEMKEFVKDYNVLERFGSPNNQTVSKLYLNDNADSSNIIGKILTHDIRAFTTSQYRNGHIIWGEAEVLHHQTKKTVYLILPRFNNNDCHILDNGAITGKKEWSAIRKSQHIKIITLDNLDFDSEYKNLIEQFKGLRNIDLKNENKKNMNKYWKRLKVGLLSSKITVK